MATDEIHEGSTGPESQYFKLISSDGHEFFIKRDIALISSTIKDMIGVAGQFQDDEKNEFHFRDMTSPVLKTVCDYLVYKKTYTEASGGVLPPFDVNKDIAFEVLQAATFLDC